jgi:ubiquinone/menaquinone biosynthesis C-methylase UbiE
MDKNARSMTSKKGLPGLNKHNLRHSSYDDDWFAKLDRSEDISVEGYSKKCGRGHKYFVKTKAIRLAEIVKELNLDPKKMSIIDVGCGLGEASIWLKRSFRKVLGVDNSKRMVDWAKKNIPGCSFMASNACKIPVKDNTYDCAVFFNVYHHMESKEVMLKSLNEVKRIVRKGGLIFISDLNPKNPVVRNIINTNELDAAVSLGGFNKGRFPTTLNMRQCKSIFRRAGLSIAYSEYLLFFPEWLSFLYPLERILRWLPIGGVYFIVAKNRK